MSKILLHISQDYDAARSEIEKHQGRVVHRISSDVIVAEVPADFDSKLLTSSTEVSEKTVDAAASGNIASMKSEMRAQSGSAAAELADKADESTQLALAAWRHFVNEGGKMSPKEGLSWDNPAYEAPRNDEGPDAPLPEKK
jgi:hypothetical protein